MMSSNEKPNTSIELISENGPISLNLMMEEGVKALTKILSNQLQDPQGNKPMQFIIKKGDGDGGNKGDDRKVQEITDMEEEAVEMGNESNYHISDNMQSEAEIILNDQLKDILKNHESQLRLDGEEAEIIFDYETEGTADGPDSIGEKITQMIESVLPNGLGPDAQEKLRSMMEGKELTITEDGESQLRDTSITQNNDENFEVNFVTENELPEEHVHDDRLESIDGESDNCCPHHQHGSSNNNQQQPQQQQHMSKYKNYNYHDYQYEINKSNIEPNFSRLINQNKPVCLFCEYYMVFGKPPKNMIKWYNMHYGYNHLPQRNDRDNNRKRNR
ncbi:Protein IBD2 [Nakaseomyces bracarensis]|uniref:Protein IBD2 n=1 Tax=Nakaseomyces bracarensis TaxID=273131 RepID=A0ABR4NUM9_9SACH